MNPNIVRELITPLYELRADRIIPKDDYERQILEKLADAGYLTHDRERGAGVYRESKKGREAWIVLSDLENL